MTANVSTWEGASGRFGATTQPTPCKLVTGGSAKVANGDTFDVEVEATRDAVENSWCVVHLTSKLLPAPNANGDTSHSWSLGSSYGPVRPGRCWGFTRGS